MSNYVEYFTKKNAAVIITGGSSGIGECFIKRLIRLNPDFAICNISRSKPELFHGAKNCLHLSLDLAKNVPDSALLSSIDTFLENLPKKGEIVLINNSGFGTYGKFQDSAIARELEMIQLNIQAMVALTHHFLPVLIQRGGAVINVASTAAFQPTPQLSTYGATKAFVLHWSLSLTEDLRKTPVRVLCLCPGPTATQFFKAAGFDKSPLPKGLGQTADEVVDETFAAWAKEKRFVVSGWSNKLLTFFTSKLPKSLITILSGALLRKVR